MRIVINDLASHAFVYQLSNILAESGYEVYHITSNFFKSPNNGNLTITNEPPKKLKLIKINIGVSYTKTNFIKRKKNDKEYGRQVINELIKIKPDLFINCVSPIDSSILIFNFCKKNNVKFISWLQDIYSLAIKSVFTKKFKFVGYIIYLYYEHIEKKIIQNSDHIIIISKDFLSILKKWNILENKISFIPNWADINTIKVLPKKNSFSLKYNLVDKFVFLYSGTLGFKHNPNLLIQLAEYFKNRNDILILVISEGNGANWLKDQKIKHKLNNLKILNFQPLHIFPEVLASADVLIAILEEDASKYSVPSKVLSYFCAGKPTLLSISKSNLAAKIVLENQLGLVSNPNDVNDFIQNAEILINNLQLYNMFSLNSRKYAEQNFNIYNVKDTFCKIINNFL